ncbi:uncharacterized protein BDR25DRAFT_369738 [Lindgomyces ingoldianus]|uniref:Uncharacterized protein n=1 Tax=Lindgomyces ingoldianus TaxID=673940 RepID=A0ACB6QWD9_9PLEO|nr:uncharacterized protein BDR25DRAFT_369738 [Lindgomyces ingoldianus]KAF2470511.1 hypothetical protein BDR25DRAFT_369738 [Lindgomyces ingoldianus]
MASWKFPRTAVVTGNWDVRVSSGKETGFAQTAAIKVVVGAENEQQEFFVHEGLICPRSQCFEKAMSGKWHESDKKEITLCTAEPATFALYNELLYSGNLPVKDLKHASPEDEYIPLCKLYVLCEYLIDHKSQDLVLLAISARFKQVGKDGKQYLPSIKCVKIIYGGTPEESPARNMLVDFYSDHDDGTALSGTYGDVPKDFLYDLSISVLQNRQMPMESQAQQDKYKELSMQKEKQDSEMESLRRTIRNLKSRGASDSEMFDPSPASSIPSSDRALYHADAEFGLRYTNMSGIGR